MKTTKKVFSFSAIKGGVGKSSLCILAANYLSMSRKRVLVIDLDIQNSISFYYLSGDGIVQAETKNVAMALASGNASENIIACRKNLDIITSSFNLVKLRSLPVRTLTDIIGKVKDNYDYVLIDTAPTFDNIVLNSVYASDMVISPVCLTQFDWKSAVFFRNQIEMETGSSEKWCLAINQYREPRSDNPDNEVNQYLSLFEEEFPGKILKTKIPDTLIVQKAIDTGVIISRSKTKHRIYEAISEFCNEMTSEKLKKPEKF